MNCRSQNTAEKAVIFDLDGTLVDSLPDIAYNINLMLRNFGYPELSENSIKKHIGNGAKKLVKDCVEEACGAAVTDDMLEERLAFYNSAYTGSGSPKTGLFAGVKEMLSALKNGGCKLAVLTNKPQETTDKVMERLFPDFAFDTVVGQSGTVKCKPDKTAALNILKFLGVAPENAFFVGDGETDAFTALNAGVRGISVLWGYRDKAQLQAAGADFFVSSPEEVVSAIL